MTASIASADWLREEGLQQLLAILDRDGEEARIAGGAVRNALLGQPVSDIDIATTALPQEVVRRAAAAGLRTVPTGLEHGTVTVIAGGRAYEVTTLREDVETDGRRARVRFGRDWEADARRRDFTINGLYATADGRVIDHVGGIADLEQRQLRFIGDPEARIREDYLRILRFFRLFARYGGGRPDAAALLACTRLKDGIARLSAERVWSELKLLLSARDPSRALLWMRQTGVLTAVLPETERWGIDLALGLIAAEGELGWEPDPLLRLEAMLPPRPETVAELARRLRLSRRETARLAAWADAGFVTPDLPAAELRRLLYRHGASGIADRLRLELARAVGRGDEAAIAACRRLLEIAVQWKPPRFPVAGRHLQSLGIAAGPEMGRLLSRLEQAWIDSDFTLDRDALLEKAGAMLDGEREDGN